MNFDEVINRKNTHSVKWDMMEEIYGVPKDKGLPMWVADMDFKPPKCISDSIKKMHAETLKQRAHKENKLKEEANALVAKLTKS